MKAYVREVIHEWQTNLSTWLKNEPFYVTLPQLCHTFFTVCFILALIINSILDTSFLLWHILAFILFTFVIWYIHWQIMLYITKLVMSPDARIPGALISGFTALLFIGAAFIPISGIFRMILLIWLACACILASRPWLHATSAAPLALLFLIMTLSFLPIMGPFAALSLFAVMPPTVPLLIAFYAVIWLAASLARACQLGAKAARKRFTKSRILLQRHMARHLAISLALAPIYAAIWIAVLTLILAIGTANGWGNPIDTQVASNSISKDKLPLTKDTFLRPLGRSWTSNTHLLRLQDVAAVAHGSLKTPVILRSNISVASARNSRLFLSADITALIDFISRETWRLTGTPWNLKTASSNSTLHAAHPTTPTTTTASSAPTASTESLSWLIQRFDPQVALQARLFYYRLPYASSGTIKYIALPEIEPFNLFKDKLKDLQHDQPSSTSDQLSSPSKSQSQSKNLSIDIYASQCFFNPSTSYKFIEGTSALTAVLDALLSGELDVTTAASSNNGGGEGGKHFNSGKSSENEKNTDAINEAYVIESKHFLPLKDGAELHILYKSLDALLEGRSFQIVDITPFPTPALNERLQKSDLLLNDKDSSPTKEASEGKQIESIKGQEQADRGTSQAAQLMKMPFVLRMRAIRTALLQAWIGTVNFLAGYHPSISALIENAHRLHQADRSPGADEPFWTLA